MAVTQARSPWAEEVDGVVRAVSAGTLFGIPLLYTMEVWWAGTTVVPSRMVLVLVATFVVLVVLNHAAGFRETKDVRLADALRDSVEGLAIALVSVFVILVILREIDGATPLRQGLGKVVYEATPFAFGVGLARHFLSKGRTESGDDEAGEDKGGDDGDRALHPTIVDVGATLLGAVFVAFNIAPTDEVPMIAAAMSPIWLAVLVVATLVVSYCIVFEAGFSDQERRRKDAGIGQDPFTETMICYLLSLGAAATMLVFFDRVRIDQPPALLLSQIVVLGLPAAIGGAAGRIAA